MALFCSPCKPPILCPKFPRNYYAIQRPLKSNTPILETPYFKISISAPTKIFNNKAKCSSNLSSSAELEEDPPSSVVIFVKGLALSTGEGGLKAAFSRFGEVSRVKLVLDKKTKQPLGFAYVWFVREEHARTAIEDMNGQFFEGRFIHVALAKPGSCKTRPKPSAYKF
ncbi:organelle RRM domain-containing protein 6, chloroplastic-like [Salvia miltiorrhiza]|uniref:organelle RRM domain-containing protein 6, chloroplastic-like n=1 Tax=Salvia miltiorrhiza TaxID=226208 RepID=UPI0025AC1788|nr:organelle RRM domain-containing protein 6, chloroplastic-like [Salvia miltiorrhiza]